MKDRVLDALDQADGFLSGQQLSELLGVSRTAVWKAVGKLKEEGYEIEAVTNRGYRLVNRETVDILTRHEVSRRLSTRWAGRNLYLVQDTGSTNDDIMRLSEEGAPEGTLMITSHQTAGKGRRGRTWDSPDGGNVYMSILLRPRIEPGKASMITLVAALSVCDAIASFCPPSVHPGIKWPNDIVISAQGSPYKKIIGILTEMRMEDTEIRDVTVGIGLNLNRNELDETLQDKATTLSLALGHPVNRAEVTAQCWNHFEPDYEAFLCTGDLAPLRERYEAVLVNKGREVRVLDPKGEFTGLARGITPGGELIVSPREGGPDRRVGTGEISVRGVMGYV